MAKRTKKNEIALETLSTIFVDEVIRLNKKAFKPFSELKGTYSMRIPFLKMSYARRERLVSKTIDTIYSKATSK